MSKHAAAVAHFRQLCCLGLGAQAIIPSLLEALHPIVPSYWNRIIVCNDSGEVAYVYAENPEAYAGAELYFREFAGTSKDSLPTLAEVVTSGSGVGAWLPHQHAKYYRSDHYNLVERPYNVHHMLDALIVDERGPLAGVILARDKKTRPFKSSDAALLRFLIPYFAHAMRDQRDLDAALADTGQTGLVIADQHGGIRLANSNGVQFLAMAQQDPRAPRCTFSHPVLSPVLKRLCASIFEIAAGRPAPPPARRQPTPWGLLVFRASRLDNFGLGEPLVAITIELRVPEKLALMRAMGGIGLSARQKDICLGLADGLTEQQIAQRYAISVTTVAHHLRKLYLKLDVHSQAELLRVLRTRHSNEVRRHEMA